MHNGFHFDPAHGIAGAFGGTFRFFLNPNRPIWEALVSGFLGIGLAIYFTPVFHPIAAVYLERIAGAGRVEDAQLSAAVGCLIGMTAPNIIERCIDFIRSSRKP